MFQKVNKSCSKKLGAFRYIIKIYYEITYQVISMMDYTADSLL